MKYDVKTLNMAMIYCYGSRIMGIPARGAGDAVHRRGSSIDDH